MANPTTNYAFAMPTNTDLVKDLPADFEIFGQAVDTQMKTNADAAIAKTIVDAKGDIIAATAADTVARLAVGTNDQVLIADSSTATGLKWGSPSAGGMTLINTGGTALTGASVTISSIPSGYVDLKLIIRQWRPANTGDALYMRINGDSTASRHAESGTFGTGLNANFGDTRVLIAQESTNGASESLINVELFDYSNTVTRKMGRSQAITTNATSSSFNRWFGHWYYRQTDAITSLELSCMTGNFTSGTAYLYGVK